MTIFSLSCNDRERRWVLAFFPSPGVRQPNLAKIYPIHVSKDSLPENFQADKNMSQPDIIQDHLLPTSKLLKCHGRICEKGFLGYQSLTHTACKPCQPCHLDESPKCHGSASRGIVKCQRCRGRGTCCVGGWWVYVGDFSVPKMKSNCSNLGCLTHAFPVQRLQNWWSLLFICGFTVCMLCCLVSGLPLRLPSTLLFQEVFAHTPGEHLEVYFWGMCNKHHWTSWRGFIRPIRIGCLLATAAFPGPWAKPVFID